MYFVLFSVQHIGVINRCEDDAQLQKLMQNFL